MSQYDSEMAETASLRKIGVVRRLGPFIRPYRRALVTAGIFLLVLVAIDTAHPWMMGKIVDAGLQKQTPSLWRWVWLYASTALVAAVASAIGNYLTLSSGQRLMADLRRALYRRFQALTLGYFDRMPAGKTLARLVNDPDNIGEPLSAGFTLLFGSVVLILSTSAVMFVLNWRLALVSLAFVPVTVGVGLVCRPYFLRAYRRCREMISWLNVRMEEQISGHNTLVLLGQEKRSTAELDEANDAHRAAWVRVMGMHIFFTPLINMTFGLGLAFVLWYGSGLMLDEKIAAGLLVAFGQYIMEMSWPVMQLAEQIQGLQSAVAAIERMLKFLDQPDNDWAKKGSRVFSADGQSAAAEPPAQAAAPMPIVPVAPAAPVMPVAPLAPLAPLAPEKTLDPYVPTPAIFPAPPWGAGGRACGEIEFRDVWFAYRDEHWILKGLSFKVRPGERVAVAGPTGAGKTTILSLASALYRPQRGQILLDGADISELDPREVRRQVAVVIQDVFLFAGTVEENIRLWEPSFDRERVEVAARRACAHEFVAGLADGYDHRLGERAQTLSAGQRQLISFARALCFDPPVLLLDEATSSVDAWTEDLIRRGLKNITADRASIIVAHRFSTLADADRLLVIRDGVLAGETTPAEFLRSRQDASQPRRH